MTPTNSRVERGWRSLISEVTYLAIGKSALAGRQVDSASQSQQVTNLQNGCCANPFGRSADTYS